jgi:hypothetical protein
MPQFSPQDYLSNRPTLDEFIAHAQAEFSFLASDFGFTEEPIRHSARENPFQVRFVDSVCRIVIEGRSFGASVGVMFERLAGGRAQLLDILAVRSPPAAEPLQKFGDQLALLHVASSLVRQHALDAIRGDSEIYDAAEAHRQLMFQRLRG